MGVDTTLRNARTTIENAIVDNLNFAYGRRLKPDIANVPTLRSTASVSIQDRAMRFVTSAGLAYTWRQFETSADDGVNFVQPSDVASGAPGRWCRATRTGITSAAQTGYLLKSELYNDDSTNLDTFEQRLFGETPSMLLSYEDTTRHPRSTEPGALYWCKAVFTLFSVSQSARGGQTSRQGSPIPSEQSFDPGTAAMMGDAKLVLLGVNLGINDVAYVEILHEATVIKDLALARFIESLEVTVYYTETNPDPTTVALASPYEFNANYLLADANQAGQLDTANDVTSAGLQFALGDGLTQNFAGGTINVNGAPVTVAGTAHTFGASSVTYRDADATGSLFYAQTLIGDQPPALAFGRVRLGVTVTDATGVRLDRLLAAQLVPFGPIDRLDPGTLTGVAISPTSTTLPTGTDLQYTAIGTYEGSQPDSYALDVTALVTWASDNGNTTFSPSGVAHTTAPGTAHLTATLNGVASNVATLIAT